jgi:hypothetical protein
MFRERVADARQILEETIADVTQEQAAEIPAGKVMPIGGQYAHVVVAQDMALHGLLLGAAPLAATTWAGKTGFSEAPPMGPGSPLDEWSRRVTLDFAALRDYAAAVYDACDRHFAAMTDEDYNRPVDLSAFGFGEPPASLLLVNGWINNPLMHAGEISCLKGLQGAKGYAQ